MNSRYLWMKNDMNMFKLSIQVLKAITLLLALFNANISIAGFSTPTDPFEIPQGAYQAEFVRDLGHVAQIRFAGDYDMELPDGTFNRAARAVVAQEFYKNHSDDYDFLIVFTDFVVDTPEAAAFHVGIKNDIQGIGKPIFDLTKSFGSNEKLQSYIDFAELTRWDLAPDSAGYNSLLTVAMHEIMHRWVTGVEVMDNGVRSDVLIGQKDSHWSALLDSDASVMYGADWIPTSEGKFKVADWKKRYSALDLYLAGFYSPAEVGPIRYIDSTDIDGNVVDVRGVGVSGQEKIFSIADIVAAEGERVPSYEGSQKYFKAGIIFLTTDFSVPEAAVVSNLNKFGQELSVRFAHLTGGRGFINVENTSQVERDDDKNDEIYFRDNINNDLALYWLKEQQDSDFWQDTKYTSVRDSVTANRVLTLLDDTYQAQDFWRWLNSLVKAENNDDLAFVVSSGHTEQEGLLIGSQNSDGGWGLRKGFTSTLFDTATVLNQVPKLARNKAIRFILNNQNDDGGWSRGIAGASDFKTTVMIIDLLSEYASENNEALATDTAVSSSLFWVTEYLADVDNKTVSAADLAYLLNAMIYIDSDTTLLRVAVMDLISSLQQVNGSWGNSVFNTALILEALASSDTPNLAVTSDSQAKHNVTAGAPVVFKTKIENDGAVDAGKFNVALYLNEITPDKKLSQQTINSLASGSSRFLEWQWESNKVVGNQRLLVVIDEERVVSEKTKVDNVFFIDVSVLQASASANLAVFSTDINVNPDFFDAYSEEIEVTASVRNLSVIDVNDGIVSLWIGDGVPEHKLAQQLISVAATNKYDLVFNVKTEYYNSLFVRIESAVDSNSSDNLARINLIKKGAIDFELTDVAVMTELPFELGKDIEISIAAANMGSEVSSTVKLSLFIKKSGQVITRMVRDLSSLPGEIVNNTFLWRPSSSGDYALIASIDDDNLISETDETNNQKTLPLNVALSDKANLNISFSDIQEPSEIKQGGSAEFKITVRNTGAETSPASVIQLFHGNPSTGGQVVAESVLAALASEEASQVSLFWDDIKAEGKELIYVVVDPDNLIEEPREDDNKAFKEISIQAMNDLYISEELIELTPTVAVPGTDVIAKIVVANTGGQVIVESELEVLVNDISIGHYSLPQIESYSNTAIDVVIKTDALTDNAEISIVLDPANTIIEANENNNIARKTLVVGSTSLYITEPFISPNGDGVKDSAELFAELDSALGQKLVVRGLDGQDVASFAADVEYPLTWFGRINGRLLADGEYTLNIVNSDGTSTNSTAVVIDTNNTSIIEAFNSEFKLQVFYKELFGDIAWLYTYDDVQRVVFYVNENRDNQKLIPGIYTADYAGGDIRLVALEDSIKFPRSWHYGSPNYFNVISLSADNRSMILQSNTSSSWDTQYFLRVNLARGSYENITLDGDAVYHYEHDGVVYSLFRFDDGSSNGRQIKLMSVNPQTGAKTLISQASGVSKIDYDEQYKYKVKLIDKDTAVYINTLISFSEQKVTVFDSYQQGIASANGKVASINSDGELVVSTSDQLNERVYPSYSERILKNDLAFAEFSQDQSKLMLYLVDETPISTDLILNIEPMRMSELDVEFDDEIEYYELGGLKKYVKLFDRKTNAYSEEPTPIGYRVELDLLTGEYTFKSYFTRYVSMDGFEYGNRHDEIFSTLEKTEESFYNYGWGDYSVAFEGHGTGGVYLANGQFLEQSLYLESINSEEEEEVYPSFFPYAIDSAQQMQPSPFVTGFKFESLDLLSNGSMLFANTKTYDGDMTNAVRQDQRVQVSDTLFHNILNLSAYLKFVYDGDNQGVGLKVLATDKYFDRYKIEYTLNDDHVWNVIVPYSGRQELNRFVTTWVPPYEGTYSVRLTTSDKAGNTTEFTKKLIWSYGANITNITLGDDVISPNLDNVSDNLIINFKILRPSNILFEVKDHDGVSIVDSVLAVDDIGGIGQVSWDGRNSSGTKVPDGAYKVYLDGYLYYVIVDTKSPIIKNCTTNIAKNQDENDEYYGYICAKSKDENTVSEEYYEINSGSGWEILNVNDKRDELKFISTEIFDSISYRYVAIDVAGNKAVSLPLENKLNNQLMLVDLLQNLEVENNKVLPSVSEDDIPYFYINRDGSALIEFIGASSEVDIKFGYVDLSGVDQFSDLNLPVTLNKRRYSIGSASVKAALKEVGLEQTKIFFYIVVGDEVYSTSHIYALSEQDSILFDYDGMLSYELKGFSKPIGFEMHLSSINVDSVYYEPVRIFNASSNDEEFPWQHVFRELVLEACTHYTVDVVFEDGARTSYKFVTSCVDVKLSVIAPEAGADTQCNQVSSDLHYFLKVSRKAEGKKQKESIPLSGVNNVSVFLLNAQNPDQRLYVFSEEYRLSQSLSFDKALIDETKDWFINVEVSFDGGHVESFSKGKLILDDHIPVITLNSPRGGENICAQSNPALYGDLRWVELQGAIVDYGAENSFYKGIESAGVYQLALDVLSNNCSSVSEFPDELPSLICEEKLALATNISNGSRGGVLRQGVLDVLFNIDGPQSISYQVSDSSGNTSCGMTDFVVDSSIAFNLLNVSNRELQRKKIGKHYGISPNGDGIHDDLTLLLDIREDVMLEVYLGATQIYADNMKATDSIHSLVIPWNELSLPDGEYVLTVKATDSCGFEYLNSDNLVEIDNRIPNNDIIYPKPDSELFPVIGVKVDLLDKNIESYQLAVKSLESELWNELKKGVTNIYSQVIYDLNLTGLDGIYQLRLSTQDKLGNKNETINTINITSLGALLSHYEIDDKYVSPNTQGGNSSLLGMLSLTRSASVEMMMNNNKLLSLDSLNRGEHNWNLTATHLSQFRDGTYSLKLATLDALDPNVSESGSLEFVIDNTHPALTIDSENNGRFGLVSVIVIDDNALEFSYGINNIDGQEVLSSSETVFNKDNTHFVMDLNANDIAEGSYRLNYNIKDKAGNLTSGDYAFIFDKTKPVINLSETLTSGTIFNQLNEKLELSFSYIELNPISIELLNKDQVLMTVPDLTNSQIDEVVDFSQFKDGIYELTLRVIDVSGNESVAPFTMQLDSTDPVIGVINTSAEDSEFVNKNTVLQVDITDDTDLSGVILIAGEAEKKTISATQSIFWPSGLSDGKYEIEIRAKDSAGNEEILTQLLTQDNTPPNSVALVTAEAINSDINVSWSRSTSDDVRGYKVFRDGVLLEETESFSMVDELITDGSYEYYVIAVDHAGNESEKDGVYVLIIDTVAPDIAITSPKVNSTQGGEIEFVGSISAVDLASVQASIVMSGNELLLSSTVVTGNRILFANWDSSAFNGDAEFKLVAVDNSGNSAEVSHHIFIDNSAPAIPAGLSVEVSLGNTVTSNWQEVSDTQVVSYQLWRSGTNLSGNIENTEFIETEVPDGTYRYSVVSVDSIGNISAPSISVPIVVDSRAPDLTIIKPTQYEEFESALSFEAIFTDKDVVSVQLSLVDSNEVEVATRLLTHEPYSTSFDTEALDYAHYQLQVTALDSSGNTTAEVINLVKSDLTPPESITNISLINNLGQLRVSWTNSVSADAAEYEVHLFNQKKRKLRTITAVSPDVVFLDFLDPGLYSVGVVTVDTSGNYSQQIDSIQIPYNVVETIFPYFATPKDVESITVMADFSGVVEIQQGNVAINSANFVESEAVTLEQALINSSESSYVHTQYDSVHTAKPIEYLLRNGDKPATPLTPEIIQQDTNQLTISAPTNMLENQFWFYKRNNRLERVEGSLGGSYTYLSNQVPGSYNNPDSILESNLRDPTWVGGFRLKNYTNLDSGIIEYAEAWNGINWMRLPFSLHSGEEFQEMEFDFPVHTNKIRIKAHANIGKEFSFTWTPVLTNVHPYSENAVVNNIDSDLNGIGADGITLTTALISEVGVIGAPSAELQLLPHEDAALPEILLSAELINGLPVLDWNSEARIYDAFYITHNSGEQIEIVSDGTGEYIANDPIYREGLNTYSIIGVTFDGKTKVSNEVEVSLILDSPLPVEGLTATVNPIDRSVELSWQDQQTDIRYEVYRKHLLEIVFGHVGSTDQLEYADFNIQLDSMYEYYVIAVNIGEKQSAPSNIISVNTLSGVVNTKPKILYPITGFLTLDKKITVLTASLPAQELVYRNNGNFEVGSMTSSALGLDVKDLNIDSPPLGIGSTIGNQVGSSAIDLYTGEAVDWILNPRGPLLYKGGDHAYIQDWDGITRYSKNGSELNLSGIEQFDVSADGTVLALTNYDRLAILYGPYLSNVVNLDENLAALFANGLVAVSPNSNFIAVSANGRSIIINITDLNNLVLTYISDLSDTIGDLTDLVWLSSNRLALVGSEVLVLDSAGSTIYNIKPEGLRELRIIGSYVDNFVVLHFNNALENQLLVAHNIINGNQEYLVNIPTQDMSYMGRDDYVTGYGQFCTLKNYQYKSSCRLLPGVEETEINLSAARNSLTASRNLITGEQIVSDAVVVHKSAADINNVELVVSETIRSLGRVSDFIIELNHNSGSSVVVNSVQLMITGPNGDTHSELLENIPAMLSSGDRHVVNYQWQPSELGQYHIEVVAELDDDLAADNVVKILAAVANVNEPRLALNGDSQQFIGIELDTQAWKGIARLVATLTDYNGEQNTVIADEIYSDYSNHQYQLNISQDLWDYGFDLTVNYISEDDQILASQSLNIKGESLPVGGSTVSVTSPLNNIVQGQTIALSYILDISTPALFSGSLNLVATNSDGSRYPLTNIPLSYLLDGDHIEQSYSLDSSALFAGNYQIVAELFDAQLNKIDSSSVTLSITEAPVRYAGSIIIEDTRVGMGVNLSAEINVSGSMSNRPEGISIYLSMSGVDDLKIIDMRSNELPYSGVIDLSSLSVNLGDKEISLKVAPELRNIQLLDQVDIAIIDIEPPVLNIISPTNNGFVNNFSSAVVAANDTHSGIDNVLLTTALGNTYNLIRSNDDLYTAPLSVLNEGSNRLVLTAYDVAGNFARSDEITVVMDSSLPLVSIAGAMNGSIYNHDVNISASANDANLAEVFIFNNGRAVQGYQLVVTDDGEYNITANAVDHAGNSAQASVSFTVDKTAPVVNISGVQDGAAYREGISYAIDILDANPQDLQVTLNGIEVEPSGAISEDGMYVLEVTATDSANNSVSTKVDFIVDTTAPILPSINLFDGEVFEGAQVSVYGIGEVASRINLRLNGVLFDSMIAENGYSMPLILEEGTNEIEYWAADAIGNESHHVHISVILTSLPEFELVAQDTSIAKTLIWMPWYDVHSDKTELFVRSALNESGMGYHISTNEIDFTNQLRSNRYTVVVLMHMSHILGLPTGFSALLNSELRAKVSQGMGLVSISNQLSLFDIWDDVSGIRDSYTDVIAKHFYLTDEVLGNYELELNGLASRAYVETDASGLGKLTLDCLTIFHCREIKKGQYPGILDHYYGAGRVITSTINLITASPENDAQRLFRQMIYRVAPSDVVGFNSQWKTLDIVSSGGDIDDLKAVFRFDNSIAEVYLDNLLISQDNKLELSMSQKLFINLLGVHSLNLDIDIYYQDEFVRTESIVINSSLSDTDSDWQKVMSFVDQMDVPWYKKLSHYLLRKNLAYARDHNIIDYHDLAYVREKILSSLSTTKIEFKDQSEAFAIVTGKVLNNIEEESKH